MRYNSGRPMNSAMSSTVLIASSDENTREKLKSILASVFPLIVVEESKQCLAALQQKAIPALAFVGTSIDDDNDLFEEIRKTAPRLDVIAIGENGDEDETVAAVQRGATGYTMLPLRPDDILALAQKTIKFS